MNFDLLVKCQIKDDQQLDTFGYAEIADGSVREPTYSCHPLSRRGD